MVNYFLFQHLMITTNVNFSCTHYKIICPNLFSLSQYKLWNMLHFHGCNLTLYGYTNIYF